MNRGKRLKITTTLLFVFFLHYQLLLAFCIHRFETTLKQQKKAERKQKYQLLRFDHTHVCDMSQSPQKNIFAVSPLPQHHEGFASPLDIAASHPSEHFASGAVRVETTCCGVDFHQRNIRQAAIIICAITTLCAFLLLCGSIWVLEEISTIATSSCCLPIICNESAVFVLSAVSASHVRSETGALMLPDNGLCHRITPAQARAMGCVAELAVAQGSSNCTVAGTSAGGGGPSQCRGRSSFPIDFATASCALGIVAFAATLLFLATVGTDGYYHIFGERNSSGNSSNNTNNNNNAPARTTRGCGFSRFALSFLLFAITLVCNAAGIALAVRPFNIALLRASRPVELEPAFSDRGRTNLFMTAQAAGPFSDSLVYSDGCGSLARTRVSVVGFIEFGGSSGVAVEGREGQPLAAAFHLLMIAHGLVFFFVTVTLSLSWQAGGILHILLWRAEEGGAGAADSEDDEKLRALVVETQQKMQTEQDRALAEKIMLARIRQQRAKAAASSPPQLLLLPFSGGGAPTPPQGSSHSQSAPASSSPRQRRPGHGTLPLPHDPSSSVSRNAFSHAFMTSLFNSDSAHPGMSDDGILVRTKLKMAEAANKRSSSSPKWQHATPPLCVDASGRMMI